MSDENNNENRDLTASGNLFWPILFLVFAFDVFLMTQIHSRWNILSNSLGQQKTITQQIQEAQKQVTEARIAVTMVEGLAKDVLAMSHTDPDVQRLVDKYKSMGISINQPTTGVSTNK